MSIWRRISSYPLRGVEAHLDDHLRLVLLSVELLNDLADACKDYDWAMVETIAERIACVEREADDVKRNVESSLFKGHIFVGLKEDFYKLAETVDQIADRSKEASRSLYLRQPEKEAIALLFDGETNLDTMIAGTVEIVERLERAIDVMSEDMKKALQMAHEVEKTEERLDDVKLEIIRHLAQNEKNMYPLTFLQLRDFIFLLDDVADAAEEASDVLTEMIVKSGA